MYKPHIDQLLTLRTTCSAATIEYQLGSTPSIDHCRKQLQQALAENRQWIDWADAGCVGTQQAPSLSFFAHEPAMLFG